MIKFSHQILHALVFAVLCCSGCATHQAQGPIEEAGWISLGGIEQWVTIRGDDQRNPILLHVHGGPGFAASAFVEEFAPYESDFTVVQWDQRGAGRTFGRYGEETPEVTLDRVAQDGIELAENLRTRFAGRPVIIFGHSLGTLIGIDMVKRAPNRFAAYVGTAQFSNFQDAVKAQIAYLRSIGEAKGDAALLAQIDAIQLSDPISLQEFFAVNRILASYVPLDDKAWFSRMQARFPEVMTSVELAIWSAGREFSADMIMPQIIDTNLFATAPRLPIPIIFIQGEKDIYSPTALAVSYFKQVDAPDKALVIVKDAAHFPYLTHPQEFLSALRKNVLPLVTKKPTQAVIEELY